MKKNTGSYSDCTSKINVNQSIIAVSIQVSVLVYHAHIDEIKINLISPDNTTVIFFNAYYDNTNLNKTYSDQSLFQKFFNKSALGP